MSPPLWLGTLNRMCVTLYPPQQRPTAIKGTSGTPGNRSEPKPMYTGRIQRRVLFEAGDKFGWSTNGSKHRYPLIWCSKLMTCTLSHKSSGHHFIKQQQSQNTESQFSNTFKSISYAKSNSTR